MAIWLAVTALGATLVPSDPEASARELAGCLGRTHPAVGVGSLRRAGAYREGAARQAGLHVVLIDEDDTGLAPIRPGRAADGSRPDTADPGPGDRVAVMFTSGTTSQPKGVVLTQGELCLHRRRHGRGRRARTR